MRVIRTRPWNKQEKPIMELESSSNGVAPRARVVLCLTDGVMDTIRRVAGATILKLKPAFLLDDEVEAIQSNNR